MEDNKLIKVKEGIFNKIYKYIKLLFFKNTKITEDTKEESDTTIRTNIRNELKVEGEADNSYQKEQFMRNISENPELLENFSLERLRKIREYYEESIKRKEEILKNMKKCG